jgi:hypothetical protein
MLKPDLCGEKMSSKLKSIERMLEERNYNIEYKDIMREITSLKTASLTKRAFDSMLLKHLQKNNKMPKDLEAFVMLVIVGDEGYFGPGRDVYDLSVKKTEDGKHVLNEFMVRHRLSDLPHYFPNQKYGIKDVEEAIHRVLDKADKNSGNVGPLNVGPAPQQSVGAPPVNTAPTQQQGSSGSSPNQSPVGVEVEEDSEEMSDGTRLDPSEGLQSGEMLFTAFTNELYNKLSDEYEYLFMKNYNYAITKDRNFISFSKLMEEIAANFDAAHAEYKSKTETDYDNKYNQDHGIDEVAEYFDKIEASIDSGMFGKILQQLRSMITDILPRYKNNADLSKALRSLHDSKDLALEMLNEDQVMALKTYIMGLVAEINKIVNGAMTELDDFLSSLNMSEDSMNKLLDHLEKVIGIFLSSLRAQTEAQIESDLEITDVPPDLELDFDVIEEMSSEDFDQDFEPPSFIEESGPIPLEFSSEQIQKGKSGETLVISEDSFEEIADTIDDKANTYHAKDNVKEMYKITGYTETTLTMYKVEEGSEPEEFTINISISAEAGFPDVEVIEEDSLPQDYDFPTFISEENSQGLTEVSAGDPEINSFEEAFFNGGEFMTQPTKDKFIDKIKNKFNGLINHVIAFKDKFIKVKRLTEDGEIELEGGEKIPVSEEIALDIISEDDVANEENSSQTYDRPTFISEEESEGLIEITLSDPDFNSLDEEFFRQGERQMEEATKISFIQMIKNKFNGLVGHVIAFKNKFIKVKGITDDGKIELEDGKTFDISEEFAEYFSEEESETQVAEEESETQVAEGPPPTLDSDSSTETMEETEVVEVLDQGPAIMTAKAIIKDVNARIKGGEKLYVNLDYFADKRPGAPKLEGGVMDLYKIVYKDNVGRDGLGIIHFTYGSDDPDKLASIEKQFGFDEIENFNQNAYRIILDSPDALVRKEELTQLDIPEGERDPSIPFFFYLVDQEILDKSIYNESVAKNVTQVDLSGKEPMPDVRGYVGLDKLSGVKFLILKGMNLTSIPNQVYNLKNLELLDLSDNNLEDGSINYDTLGRMLPGLTYLNLEGNLLSNVPSKNDLLKMMPDLRIYNYQKQRTGEVIESMEDKYVGTIPEVAVERTLDNPTEKIREFQPLAVSDRPSYQDYQKQKDEQSLEQSLQRSQFEEFNNKTPEGAQPLSEADMPSYRDYQEKKDKQSLEQSLQRSQFEEFNNDSDLNSQPLTEEAPSEFASIQDEMLSYIREENRESALEEFTIAHTKIMYSMENYVMGEDKESVTSSIKGFVDVVGKYFDCCIDDQNKISMQRAITIYLKSIGVSLNADLSFSSDELFEKLDKVKSSYPPPTTAKVTPQMIEEISPEALVQHPIFTDDDEEESLEEVESLTNTGVIPYSEYEKMNALVKSRLDKESFLRMMTLVAENSFGYDYNYRVKSITQLLKRMIEGSTLIDYQAPRNKHVVKYLGHLPKEDLQTIADNLWQNHINRKLEKNRQEKKSKMKRKARIKKLGFSL